MCSHQALIILPDIMVKCYQNSHHHVEVFDYIVSRKEETAATVTRTFAKPVTKVS